MDEYDRPRLLAARAAAAAAYPGGMDPAAAVAAHAAQLRAAVAAAYPELGVRAAAAAGVASSNATSTAAQMTDAAAAFHARFSPAGLGIPTAASLPFLNGLFAGSIPAPPTSPFRNAHGGLVNMRPFWPPTPPPDTYSRCGLAGNYYPMLSSPLVPSTDSSHYPSLQMPPRINPQNTSSFANIFDPHKDVPYLSPSLRLGASPLSGAHSLAQHSPTSPSPYLHLDRHSAPLSTYLHSSPSAPPPPPLKTAPPGYDFSPRTESELTPSRLNSPLEGATLKKEHSESLTNLNVTNVVDKNYAVRSASLDNIHREGSNEKSNQRAKVAAVKVYKHKAEVTKTITTSSEAAESPKDKKPVIDRSIWTYASVTTTALVTATTDTTSISSSVVTASLTPGTNLSTQNRSKKLGSTRESNSVVASSSKCCNCSNSASEESVKVEESSEELETECVEENASGFRKELLTPLTIETTSPSLLVAPKVELISPDLKLPSPVAKRLKDATPTRDTNLAKEALSPVSDIVTLVIDKCSSTSNVTESREISPLTSRIPSSSCPSVVTTSITSSSSTVSSIRVPKVTTTKPSWVHPRDTSVTVTTLINASSAVETKKSSEVKVTPHIGATPLPFVKSYKSRANLPLARVNTNKSNTLISSNEIALKVKPNVVKPNIAKPNSDTGEVSEAVNLSVCKTPSAINVPSDNLESSKNILVKVKPSSDHGKLINSDDKTFSELSKLKKDGKSTKANAKCAQSVKPNQRKLIPNATDCQQVAINLSTSRVETIASSATSLNALSRLVSTGAGLNSTEVVTASWNYRGIQKVKPSSMVSSIQSENLNGGDKTNANFGKSVKMSSPSKLTASTVSTSVGHTVTASRTVNKAKYVASSLSNSSKNGNIPVHQQQQPCANALLSMQETVSSTMLSVTSSVIPTSVGNSSIPVGIAVAQLRQDSSNIHCTNSAVNSTNQMPVSHWESESVVRTSLPAGSWLTPTPVVASAPVVTPTVWVGQAPFTTTPAPTATATLNSLDTSQLPLPPGGFQLARDPISGQMFLLPTSNIEIVDRSNIWSTYQQPTVQQIVTQPTAFHQQIIQQVTNGTKTEVKPRVAQIKKSFGNIQSSNHIEAARETKEVKVIGAGGLNATVQSTVAGITVQSNQPFTFPGFTATNGVPATLSYFYEPPTILHLTQTQATTAALQPAALQGSAVPQSVQLTSNGMRMTGVQSTTGIQITNIHNNPSHQQSNESYKRSQATSPLNGFSPSVEPQHSNIIGNGGHLADSADEDDVEDEDSDNESFTISQQPKPNSMGVTMAIQVDMDASTDNDYDEPQLQSKSIVQVHDSANQTDTLFSDSAKEDTGDECRFSAVTTTTTITSDQSRNVETFYRSEKETDSFAKRVTTEIQTDDCVHESSVGSHQTESKPIRSEKELEPIEFHQNDSASNVDDKSDQSPRLEIVEDINDNVPNREMVETTRLEENVEENAPLLPTKSHMVMDFIDHHGLDLLVDSIEEFASRQDPADKANPIATTRTLNEIDTAAPSSAPPEVPLESVLPRDSSYVCDIDPNYTDGLGILCALAEQRFREEHEKFNPAKNVTDNSESRPVQHDESRPVNEIKPADRNEELRPNRENKSWPVHRVESGPVCEFNKRAIETRPLNIDESGPVRLHHDESRPEPESRTVLKRPVDDSLNISESLNACTNLNACSNLNASTETKDVREPRLRRDSSSRDSSPSKCSQSAAGSVSAKVSRPSFTSEDSMDPAEVEMRFKLAELQRKYKEKQRELAKLKPKKEKEDSDGTCKKERTPGKSKKSRLSIFTSKFGMNFPYVEMTASSESENYNSSSQSESSNFSSPPTAPTTTTTTIVNSPALASPAKKKRKIEKESNPVPVSNAENLTSTNNGSNVKSSATSSCNPSTTKRSSSSKKSNIWSPKVNSDAICTSYKSNNSVSSPSKSEHSSKKGILKTSRTSSSSLCSSSSVKESDSKSKPSDFVNSSVKPQSIVSPRTSSDSEGERLFVQFWTNQRAEKLAAAAAANSSKNGENSSSKSSKDCGKAAKQPCSSVAPVKPPISNKNESIQRRPTYEADTSESEELPQIKKPKITLLPKTLVVEKKSPVDNESPKVVPEEPKERKIKNESILEDKCKTKKKTSGRGSLGDCTWNRRRSERIFLHDAGVVLPSTFVLVDEQSNGSIGRDILPLIEPARPHRTDLDSVHDKRDRCVPDELFTALRQCRLSEGTRGDPKVIAAGSHRASTQSEESSFSEGDIPLSLLVEKNSTQRVPALPSCILTSDRLVDLQRVITQDEDLYYAGYIKAIQPPDIYGIVLDGERGNKPHIFSREEMLEEAFVEVKPYHTSQIPIGSRVCAYWSQQYRHLYPGLVAKPTSSKHIPDKGMVFVEFDDGDSGRIPLEDIRVLPQELPTQVQESQQSNVVEKISSKNEREASEARQYEVKTPVTVKESKPEATVTTSATLPKPSESELEKINKAKLKRSKKLSKAAIKKSSKKSSDCSPGTSNGSDSSSIIPLSFLKNAALLKKKSKKNKNVLSKNKTLKESSRRDCYRIVSGTGSDPASCCPTTSTSSPTNDESSNSGSLSSGKTKKKKKRKGEHKHKHHHRKHHCHHHHKKHKHDKVRTNTESSKDASRDSPSSSAPISISRESTPDNSPRNAADNKIIVSVPVLHSPYTAKTERPTSNVTRDTAKSELTVKIKTPHTETKIKNVVPDTVRENDDKSFKAKSERQETSVERMEVKETKVPKKKKERQNSVEKSKIAAFLPARQLWKWSGKSVRKYKTKGKGKKEYYKAITRGKETIRVGDCAVFLSTGRPHLPYVGRIDTMWESWGGNMVVKVVWFYHPEETKGGKKINQIKGALYESPHDDENDVQTISHKCEVLSWGDYQKWKVENGNGSARYDSAIDSEDVYYLAGTYEPHAKILTLAPGVS